MCAGWLLQQQFRKLKLVAQRESFCDDGGNGIDYRVRRLVAEGIVY